MIGDCLLFHGANMTVQANLDLCREKAVRRAVTLRLWHERRGVPYVWHRNIKGLNMLLDRLARATASVVLSIMVLAASPAAAADDPDLIFRKSTVFRFLTPNDKLATYGLDDPAVEGVACHYTLPEKGGIAGTFGVAEQVSDISLACRQYGPITFKEKFAQGDVVFSERRSFIFKKMQIVRGCDTKRNVLVYMVYSDKLIEGSPKNSTSTVPIAPWGGSGEVQKCADWLKG